MTQQMKQEIQDLMAPILTALQATNGALDGITTSVTGMAESVTDIAGDEARQSKMIADLQDQILNSSLPQDVKDAFSAISTQSAAIATRAAQTATAVTDAAKTVKDLADSIPDPPAPPRL